MLLNKPIKHKNKWLWALVLSLFCSITLYINWPHGKPYTDGLPSVDKVILFRMSKQCDSCPLKPDLDVTRTGKEAEDFAHLWRKLYFNNRPTFCSEIRYGYELKFYRQEQLLVHVRFGESCESLEFLAPKLEKNIGFSSQGYRGTAFIQ